MDEVELPGVEEVEACISSTTHLIMRVGMAVILLLAALVSFSAAVASVTYLTSSAFKTYSLVAFELWYPSMYGLELLRSFLTLVGSILCSVGIVAVWGEPRALLKQLYVVLFLLSLGLLCLAITNSLELHNSKQASFSTINLVCARPQAYGCTPAARAPTRRLDVPSAAAKVLRNLPGASSSGLSPEGCEALANLCSPPSGFNPLTSCVCSGFSVPILVEQSAARRAEAQGNQLLGTQAPPLSLPPQELGTLLLRKGHFLRRLAAVFGNTEGEYCGNWTLKGSSNDVDQCFVEKDQLCSADSIQLYTGTRDKYLSHDLYLGSGPCGTSVESRSALVAEGYEEAFKTLPRSTVASVGFFISAVLLVILRAFPSSMHIEIVDYSLGGGEVSARNFFELDFLQAQVRAVQGLQNKDADAKLRLHGLLKQVREGDVRGRRPGFFDKAKRAQYDAWARNRGMSAEEAMQAYVALVNERTKSPLE